MQIKNSIDKIMESKGDRSVAKELDTLAKKDIVDLKFDIDADILNTLKSIHLKEAPDMSFDAWLNSKDDDYFKRLEYAGGGKVIQFPIDLTKYKDIKPKEINLSGSFDKDRTIDSLSSDERALVDRLLRMSLGKGEK
ncbi:hypothetical protein OAN79_00570 [Candidatus Pelagibacter sp.]|nr:hypothetical protein [Candidatus Pelagibacter sp.]